MTPSVVWLVFGEVWWDFEVWSWGDGEGGGGISLSLGSSDVCVDLSPNFYLQHKKSIPACHL